jgi:hypothetical protein
MVQSGGTIFCRTIFYLGRHVSAFWDLDITRAGIEADTRLGYLFGQRIDSLGDWILASASFHEGQQRLNTRT